jgi:hypothetical protein
MRQLARAEGKTAVIRGPALFRGTVLGLVVIGVTTGLGFALTRQNNGVYVGGIAVGLACWLIWSIGVSSKVIISNDGIRVDNFFVSHVVSWKDFDSFVLDSGIWLTKRDESRVYLVGFAGSLFGALTRYRSMRKRLVILQEAGKRYRNAAGSWVTRDRVRLGLPVLGGWILFLEAAAFLGRALH